MGCELIIDKTNLNLKTPAVNTSSGVGNTSTSNSCSESNEDTFITAENNSTLIKAKSTGIFATFSRVIKNIACAIFFPLIKVLDLIQGYRCSSELEKVRNRNFAKNQEEVSEYHKSILFDEKNLDEKKLFRYHSATGEGEKSLIVLFMGNKQTHMWSEDSAGVKKLYEKLKKDNKADVLLLRVGDAWDDVMHKTFLSKNCSLNTDIVYQHSLNVIEDAISSKGMFQGKSKPSKISFVGYSWGGGTVDKILNEDWEKMGHGIPVAATVQIDAVHLGTSNVSTPVTERPPHSQKHLNIFQYNYDFLNGSHQNINTTDESLVLTDGGSTHNNIDDNEHVFSKVYSFIKKIL